MDNAVYRSVFAVETDVRTGTDNKINSKINQTNTKENQNTIIYYVHTHAHKRNIN